MPGLEIVGVVLGALPLTIIALEQYANGVGTLERWRKYDARLRSLIRTVQTQEQIFKNILEHLLTVIVRADDRIFVLINAGGEAWHKAGIEEKLKDRLREAYSCYVGNLQAMSETINEIKGKLLFNSEGQARSHIFSRLQHKYKRVKFTLEHTVYADQVAQLERLNSALGKLTVQAIELESTRKTLRNSVRTSCKALKCKMRCVGSRQGHTVKCIECRDSRIDDVGMYTAFPPVQTPNAQWQEFELSIRSQSQLPSTSTLVKETEKATTIRPPAPQRLATPAVQG
ncbi:hypothetical protein OPT61_g6422 [Boeremia exigua]|uniref:Uncharacterized protein n=1 Tax=Boeremia exigua TaxID=749465 RepID=A0ACC2I6N4_9PLEO|nr:hypothetical protein OPT61_g6422 [Boeremia exigua]